MFSLIGNPVAEIRAIPRGDDTTRDLAVGLFGDCRDFGDTAVGLSALTASNELFAGVYMTVNRHPDEFEGVATGNIGKGWGVGPSN